MNRMRKPGLLFALVAALAFAAGGRALWPALLGH